MAFLIAIGKLGEGSQNTANKVREKKISVSLPSWSITKYIQALGFMIQYVVISLMILAWLPVVSALMKILHFG
ncbi:MAG: hypothetical protein ACYC2P_01645 [Paludibacteraceae bacterium]